MSVESCCSSLKATFQIYHEYHLIKYDKIISDIKEYLNKHAPIYTIEHGDIIDTEEITNIGDDYHIIPIFVILKLFDTNRNFEVSTKDILDVIDWYLQTYQPSCKLKIKEKLVLSSYYGEMKNP